MILHMSSLFWLRLCFSLRDQKGIWIQEISLHKRTFWSACYQMCVLDLSRQHGSQYTSRYAFFLFHLSPFSAFSAIFALHEEQKNLFHQHICSFLRWLGTSMPSAHTQIKFQPKTVHCVSNSNASCLGNDIFFTILYNKQRISYEGLMQTQGLPQHLTISKL